VVGRNLHPKPAHTISMFCHWKIAIQNKGQTKLGLPNPKTLCNPLTTQHARVEPMWHPQAEPNTWPIPINTLKVMIQHAPISNLQHKHALSMTCSQKNCISSYLNQFKGSSSTLQYIRYPYCFTILLLHDYLARGSFKPLVFISA
jgi:hypothetical protein